MEDLKDRHVKMRHVIESGRSISFKNAVNFALRKQTRAKDKWT